MLAYAELVIGVGSLHVIEATSLPWLCIGWQRAVMPLLSLWIVRNEQSALVLQVIVNINFVVPNLYLLAVPCSWQSHIIRMLPITSLI